MPRMEQPASSEARSEELRRLAAKVRTSARWSAAALALTSASVLYVVVGSSLAPLGAVVLATMITLAGIAALTTTTMTTSARSLQALAQREPPKQLAAPAATAAATAAVRTHASAHHLFADRERLLPKRPHEPGMYVALAVDAADVPEGLLAYLELLEHEGVQARLLVLDPSSSLVSRHRFAVAEAPAATESLRAKMRTAIAVLRAHASVRLYDAIPLGNLVIVDERIFYGGIPSVATDVSLPLVELTAARHGPLHWSYRRNFERLWDAAQPVEAS